MSTSQIMINREDMLQACRSLAISPKERTPYDLLISTEDNQLVIEWGPITVRVEGQGALDGQARLPGKLARSLRQFVPLSEQFAVGQQPGYINFGSFKISCTWIPKEIVSLKIPNNTSIIYLLGFAKHHSVEVIIRSGLQSKLAGAESEKLDRLTRALKTLEPFGITREELESLIDKGIDRLYQLNFSDQI